jgi:twitching motility protein PilT
MTQAAEQGLKVNLHQLLRAMIEKGASDMHITTGSPPLLRIDGAIVPLKLPPLSPVETKQLCYSVLTEEQKIEFEKSKELDLSFGVKNLSRFRANIFLQRGAVSGAFRSIPFKILSFDELGLPPIVARLAEKPRGLVLVTGPTGSGKSTTLASILDKINSETRQHIITIEDPIEYLHPHKRCILNQREVGSDTASFKLALKYVLRQDPDVVLVGEMRDLETISLALTAAETGHLVLSTLHTNNVAQTVDRVIDVFPADQHEYVRQIFANVIQGIVSQTLLTRKDGRGRIAAMEVLVPTPAVRNMIRESKSHQVFSLVQTGSEHGMQTMDQCLAGLLRRGLISEAIAYAGALDKKLFAKPEEMADGSRL